MADTRNQPQGSTEQIASEYKTPDWAAEAIRAGQAPADAGIAETGKRTITRGTQLAAGLVLTSAVILGGVGSGNAEAAENTAACRARIIAEYDVKISQAQSTGNTKAIDVYTRQRNGFLAKCDKLDVIARNQQETVAIQQETVAIQQETVAIQQETVAYNKLSRIFSKISSNAPLTMNDVQALEQGYETIRKLPPSPTSEQYLRELRNILTKLGRSV